MAVKRLTIELDDSPDADRSTSPPAGLLPKDEVQFANFEGTDIPSRQGDYREAEAEMAGGKAGFNEIVGRTPSDLVLIFVNRPEFIATGLTILAFVVFIRKVSNSSDLVIPVMAAICFNAVWFGVSGCRWLVKWVRNLNQ